MKDYRENRSTFVRFLKECEVEQTCFLLPALTKNTRKRRYQHLTPMQKLYVTLQFYATASYLLAATSQIIEEVTNALVAVSPQFIRFPSAEDYPAVKRAFYKLELTRHGRGFPNVLGLRALAYDTSIRNYFYTRHAVFFTTFVQNIIWMSKICKNILLMMTLPVKNPKIQTMSR
ncbi:hypothetical protein BDFB_013776 [Asbolus verrucosus]|uniref:Uncharacterized protein n=1 Tax=Asbolus verrucosus TaxID=1661398 RepID=A0A482VZ28_ASBVE|nr:hypothetical protein BDFB_013776 [Asbolus verrucosus]